MEKKIRHPPPKKKSKNRILIIVCIVVACFGVVMWAVSFRDPGALPECSEPIMERGVKIEVFKHKLYPEKDNNGSWVRDTWVMLCFDDGMNPTQYFADSGFVKNKMEAICYHTSDSCLLKVMYFDWLANPMFSGDHH